MHRLQYCEMLERDFSSGNSSDHAALRTSSKPFRRKEKNEAADKAAAIARTVALRFLTWRSDRWFRGRLGDVNARCGLLLRLFIPRVVELPLRPALYLDDEGNR